MSNLKSFQIKLITFAFTSLTVAPVQMIVGSLYMQVGSSTTMLLGTICGSWYIPDILEKFRTGLEGLKLEEMVEKPLLLKTGNLLCNSVTSRCWL